MSFFAVTPRFATLSLFAAAAALALLAGGGHGVAATSDGATASPTPAIVGTRFAARAAAPKPAPEPAEEDPTPYTVEKARGECWMRLEHDRKAPRELEKRAVLVEKCADDKMKARAAK